MKVWGAVLITVSAVSPTSSVFIIAPAVLQQAGSGAFLSFLAAALVGVCMAFVYAELSSAFPLSGGEYAIIGRTLGPMAGFITLGLILVTMVLIVAVVALGVGTYLGAVFPGLPLAPTAAVTVLLATLIAMLHVRTGAAVTGFFLCIEITAIALLSALGLSHLHHTPSELVFHPVLLSGSTMIPAAPVAIAMAMAVAIFAYNGYGQAVYFGEEIHEAPRYVARAILWALVITVLAELIPVTAVLLGSSDFKALFASQNMLQDFIVEKGGKRLNVWVSVAVSVAIFNAVIAIILQTARLIFSTARDRVWPQQVNRALALVHGRFHSPWAATLVCGVLAATACFASMTFLLVVTGTSLVIVYGLLCLAVMAGRRGATRHGHYRMPLHPWPALAALAALAYVIYANYADPAVGRPSLLVSLGIMGISAVYYWIVLRRRGAWELRGPEGIT